MKKIIIYFIIVIIISFLIPIIFTRRNIEVSNDKGVENTNNTEIDNNKNIEINNNNYTYNEYGTINLLHSSTGEVQNISLDEYILGVVSAEMPATYEEEALKAQAIVARTYTIYIIKNSKKHNNADICDNSKCCQAWISKEDRMNKWEETAREENWSKIETAVNSTKGKVITYNGEIIESFFHSNSGGKTENVSSVWGGTDLPYLQTVETAGEDSYSQYSSEVNLNKEEFKEKMLTYHQDFTINYDDLDAIKILEYTEGGRVNKIKIGNLELSGVEMRNIVGLKSANFKVGISEDNIQFIVIGYGHGVGMSQTGANTLAEAGSSCEEIIKHFYTGVEISNI